MQRTWMVLMFLPYVCTYDMAPCTNALGCYSGEIPNEAFSASSFKGVDFKPSNARVRLDKSGGAWCPDNPIKEGSTEFLQISLQSLTLVTMVETQGRFAEGKGHEFTDRLKLQYFRGGKWYHYAQGKIINANVNTYQNELITLDPPIVLSRLRFLPYTEKDKEVCLRVEVYGCLWKGGLLSYTAPEGDWWRGSGVVVSYRDSTYDGTMEAGVMHGGLGLLTDGKHSDYEASYNNKPISNNTWLAWKRRKKDVELLFEFENLRNFSHVIFHTWDNGKDAKPFKFLTVHFLSLCHVPQQHNTIKITTTFHPHFSHHNIKVINVSLSYSVASCLRISIESSSRWIFLSEVTFVSESAKDVGVGSDEVWKDFGSIKHEKQEVEVEEGEKEEEEEKEEEIENKEKEESLKTASQSSQSQERVGILAGSIVTVFVLLLVLLVALLLSRRKQIKKYKQPHNDLLSTHAPLNEGEFAYQKSRSIKNSKLPSPPISAFHPSSQPIKFHQTGHITDCLTNQAFNSTLRPKTTLKRPKPLPPPDEFHVALNNNTTYKNIHNTAYNNINNKIVDNLLDNDNFLRNTNLFNKSLLIDNDDNNNDNTWIATADKQPPQIPRDAITFLTHVGEGVFSQVHQCQLHGNNTLLHSYDLRSSVQRDAMDRKVQRLLSFQGCSTLTQLVGVCMEASPGYVLLESSPDLYTFLNQHPSLTYGSLIYMASQIAAGLKHLEMRGVVHGDVACRTCVVFNNLHVKLSDTQACKGGSFSHHYYLDPRTSTMLPIRWMAWEAYLYNNQSSKSDVWMFGVTLWEILNMANQRPFNEMADKMVIENMRLMGKQDDIYTCIDNKLATLSQPPSCPKETYDLIKECCNVDCEVRPSFQDVHRFLQMNNSGFNIQSDLSVQV